MRRKPLSERQRDVFDVITSTIAQRGFAPTVREIGEAVGIRSTNGINDHLNALERKGYIRRRAMQVRGIELVEDERVVRVPAPLWERLRALQTSDEALAIMGRIDAAS